MRTVCFRRAGKTRHGVVDGAVVAPALPSKLDAVGPAHRDPAGPAPTVVRR
jgi:hypothetical protein